MYNVTFLNNCPKDADDEQILRLRFTPTRVGTMEQIINKLREAEVELSRGITVGRSETGRVVPFGVAKKGRPDG